MKSQRIFLSLTFLSIIICQFECNTYFCDNFGNSAKSGLDEDDSNCGGNNVCCNSDIIEVMRATFDQAKKESYQNEFEKLLKSFKILNKEIKTSHIIMNPQRKDNRTDGEVIYYALHHAACNKIKNPESMTKLDSKVISTLENTKCICNHPIVKDLVEQRAESISNIYTNYNDGLKQLRELTTKINLVGKGNLEDELLDKQLKAIVCKQCSGQKEPMCMSECHELINLGMTFEAKKLQLLEGTVKLTQARFEEVSKLFEEFKLDFENAILSIGGNIVAKVLVGKDFSNCEENKDNDITEERSIFADVGASCSNPPSKCNPVNTASCTLKKCKDQCMVNCCDGSSKNKCTIPTCVGCKGTAADTCKTNTANQCAGISEKQNRIKVERITELLYTIQDQIEESKRNLGSNGRYICQQLMETHEDINLIKDSNEREFGGDFDNMLNEVFSEEQMQYYLDDNQPMNDALNEFNELGVF